MQGYNTCATVMIARMVVAAVVSCATSKLVCPVKYWTNYKTVASNHYGFCTAELECLDSCHTLPTGYFTTHRLLAVHAHHSKLSCLDSISCINPCADFKILGDFNHLNYPLKQVVKCATRKSIILDKIYTNNNLSPRQQLVNRTRIAL